MIAVGCHFYPFGQQEKSKAKVPSLTGRRLERTSFNS
jgi:hypothetical protein